VNSSVLSCIFVSLHARSFEIARSFFRALRFATGHLHTPSSVGVPALTQEYDFRLVILSVLIAISASYAALNLAGRTAASRGRVRLAWISGGALAMGLGIWSIEPKSSPSSNATFLPGTDRNKNPPLLIQPDRDTSGRSESVPKRRYTV
jgi:hypothetical protein